MRLIRILTVLTFMMMASAHSVLAQCAMCRATVENNVSYGETSLASGLNMGILYLFFAPYVVLGVIAFFWFKKSRVSYAKKIRWIRHPQS